MFFFILTWSNSAGCFILVCVWLLLQRLRDERKREAQTIKTMNDSVVITSWLLSSGCWLAEFAISFFLATKMSSWYILTVT
jgi:hypothetical protein